MPINILIEEILFNKDISNELKKDIITENTALEPLLKLCKKNTIQDYEKLYNDVIQELDNLGINYELFKNNWLEIKERHL